jgi:branched-chain amino acid transport system ATP-binding protein
MLNLRKLHAHYGPSHVLHGVDLTVGEGEIVALLGRNGSGRSTTAKAIMGLVQAQGEMTFRGQSLIGQPTYDIAQLGLGYVPESRDVFPNLTVRQNLALGEKRSANPGQPRWRYEDMWRLFPRLKEREHTAAGVLSGGEQQMLTLCRTLMGNPALVVIDEPTEGLAPMLVAQVAECLAQLKARGVAVLLIEQKLSIALRMSDRVLVMGHGRIVWQGTPAQLRADEAVRQAWLAV